MYEAINAWVAGAMAGGEEATLQLMEALEPLMLKQINRHFPYSPRPDREDLLSEARVLLLDCLDLFDPSRGARFLYFYKTQLRFYLLDRVKAAKRLPLAILDAPGEEGETLLDLLVSGDRVEDRLLAQEDRALLKKALGALSPREGQVIRLFYGEDLGLSEIAGFLGLSYQTVANTKARALKKLRDQAREDLAG
ncbi:MAG: sigma-70 family RNA polymerase sigma factor [Tissierellia bacterium]|nr:sigma-70 family RNA polymerase sigma factor [Tissierellia bacterium]